MWWWSEEKHLNLFNLGINNFIEVGELNILGLQN